MNHTWLFPKKSPDHALGVTLHSVREGEVNDLMANMLALMAEEEVQRLGERVSDVRQHTVQAGWRFPGWPRFGYRWREATAEERAAGATKKVLDIDPETVPYVRELWRRADAGESLHRLAKWATQLPENARGGRRLHYSSIRRMMSSPVYVARAEDGDPDVLARPMGRWPALVDDATWRRVQERIARHERIPRQASNHYLLTGFVRCPSCGQRMHGNHSPGQAARYLCFGHTPAVTRKWCSKTVLQPALDAAVLGAVGEAIDVVAAADGRLQAAIRRAWREIQRPPESLELKRRIRDLERQAETARRRLKDAATKLVDGDLDKMAYQLVAEDAHKQLEAAEADLAQLRSPAMTATLPEIDDILDEAGGWAAVLRGTDTQQQRDVLALLVEQVTPVRLGYGAYRAEIRWTPLGETLCRLAAVLGAEREDAHKYQLAMSPRRGRRTARRASP